MSNGTGILKWDPDCVTPDTLTIDFTFRANVDYVWAPPGLTYTTQVQQTYSITDSVTATRIGPFDGTPGDDEWVLETGDFYTHSVGQGDSSLPPFFRNTAVKCDNTCTFRVAVTLDLDYTYVGPGAPANTTSSTTVHLDITANFSNTSGVTEVLWRFSMIPDSSDGALSIYPEYTTSDLDGGFNPAVTVDERTLKAGASVDFGTTWAHVTADWLSADPDYTVNAWDVQTSIQATAS